MISAEAANSACRVTPYHSAMQRLNEISATASIGIDGSSGLASDFLNQFNEVSMLLDMAGDDIEMLDELNDWEPLGYAEHFIASNFRDSALVLEAYDLCPSDTRAHFDRLSHELGGVICTGLQSIRTAPADAVHVEAQSHALASEVRARIDALSAIIHPTENAPNDDEVSALFAGRR